MELVKWFKSSNDKRVTEYINSENILITQKVTFVMFIVELISLFIFIFSNIVDEDYWSTIGRVSFCIVTCLATTIATSYILKYYRDHKTISNFWAQWTVIALYLMLSIWGIIVDRHHYLNHEQMLTFYIVQFCFFCFLVMTPIFGVITIVLSFGSFFVALYTIDKAASAEVLNILLFMIVAIIANLIKYTRLKENQENKIKIIDFNEYLNREIKTDGLTGLKNRYALENDITYFNNKQICLVMSDIDWFKSINDTYGHLAGDEILKSVAAIFKQSFGEDNVYRYGGDEFLVMIEGETAKSLEKRIEVCKEYLSNLRLEGIDKNITCSFGLSHGKYNTLNEFLKFLELADEKLYECKKRR